MQAKVFPRLADESEERKLLNKRFSIECSVVISPCKAGFFSPLKDGAGKSYTYTGYLTALLLSATCGERVSAPAAD